VVVSAWSFRKELKNMTKKKKRVYFPWLKSSIGRCSKAMIAVLCDQADWQPYFRKEESKRSIFLHEVLPKFNRHFPTLETFVKKFYLKHGRKLSHEEYIVLLYNRFCNMYFFNTETGYVEKTTEHPILSTDKKFKQAYSKARYMQRNNKIWKRKKKQSTGSK
jgi:hypothetical protein